MHRYLSDLCTPYWFTVILATIVMIVSLMIAGCAFDSLKLSVDKGSLHSQVETNFSSLIPLY